MQAVVDTNVWTLTVQRFLDELIVAAAIAAAP